MLHTSACAAKARRYCPSCIKWCIVGPLITYTACILVGLCGHKWQVCSQLMTSGAKLRLPAVGEGHHSLAGKRPWRRPDLLHDPATPAPLDWGLATSAGSRPARGHGSIRMSAWALQSPRDSAQPRDQSSEGGAHADTRLGPGQKRVVDDVIRTRARFRTNLAGWLLNHSDTSTET